MYDRNIKVFGHISRPLGKYFCNEEIQNGRQNASAIKRKMVISLWLIRLHEQVIHQIAAVLRLVNICLAISIENSSHFENWTIFQSVASSVIFPIFQRSSRSSFSGVQGEPMTELACQCLPGKLLDCLLPPVFQGLHASLLKYGLVRFVKAVDYF